MTPQQVFKGTLIVLFTLIGAYILLISVRMLIVLLLAVIIASSLRPFVTRLTRWHIPEAAAIVSVYLVAAILMAVVALAILPPIINQVANYIEHDWQLSYRIIQAQNFIANLLSNVTNSEVSLVAPDEIRTSVASFVTQFRHVIPGMVDDLGGTLGDAILIFVMGAYWLTSHQKAKEFVTQLVPFSFRHKTEAIIEEIEDTMGGYVRGVITIATIVGVLNFIGLQLLGVPNALTLSFIVGTTTTVPMIGGLVGGIIIVALTLISAPQHVIAVFVTFFIIQQLESYVLSPRIMANRVGMDPLLVIVYTAIGFLMFGVVGALIAIPVMGTLHILLWHLVIEPHQANMKKQAATKGLILTDIRPDLDSEVTIVGS